MPDTREASPLPSELLGDAAVVIPVAGSVGTPTTTAAIRAIATAITTAALPTVLDVVPSPDRVTVCYDLTSTSNLADLQATLERLASTATAGDIPRVSTRHEVPVCYGDAAGPDLDDVCLHCELDRATLIERHTAVDYLVTAVGFTPGFAYLGGLPSSMHVPRRATPRPHVPAGSVGIGGSQTGVYPCASPGGWQLIGHTQTAFFDPTASPPALCAVGDRIRFVDASATSAPHLPLPAAAVPASPQTVQQPTLTVLSPGLLTSVQDLGRPGYRSCGVTPGGAADPAAAAIANRLVGNPPDAALLEITLAGPTLRIDRDARIALTGARFPGLDSWRPHEVAAGSTLTLGHATHGCRGYLAIAGGLEVPRVLGSRSTHLAAGFGGLAGRPLIAGDQLAVGPCPTPATDARWSLSPDLLPLPEQPTRLRFLPTGFASPETICCGVPYEVTARSNRMGLRLSGPAINAAGDGISKAVLPGTVQLPPDGQPILLLGDCQTIGGYPVVGHVASVDLRLAAQLRPGESVLFEPSTLAEAQSAWHQQQRALARIATCITDRWPYSHA